MRTWLFWLFVSVIAIGARSALLGAEAAPGSYQGWKTLELSNGLVRVQVAPDIGGRVIQLTLGRFDYFWNNPQLLGKLPPPSGIQFSREIRLMDGGTHVHVDATMTNVDTRVRRWGIWSVAQHDAANRSGAGHNPNLRVWCPINPQSIFPRGYDIMFGLVGNWSYQPDYPRGLMCVHYQRRVGKVAMDSTAGWLATVNGTDGYVFVQRFRHCPGKKYPDNASVEIWLHGTGQFITGRKLNEMKDDPAECPYFVESEVLSPFAELKPGEHYTFGYDWYAAAIGGNYPVLDCTESGVLCEPFKARQAEGQLLLSGRFGLFASGAVEAEFLDGSGSPLGRASIACSADPLRPLILTESQPRLAPPPGTVELRLVLRDAVGRDLGELARTRVGG